VVASTSRVATAMDWRNRGIVVHYHNTGDERNRMYRKHGLDDSETTLCTATQVWGTQVSFGVDRGDIYVYYKKANGNVARLGYLPGPPYNGWETAETIIATATNSYPSARQDLGNSEGNVAWARVNGVGGWDLKVEPFTTSRPFINRFAVIPSAFDPSVAETTTVSYFLKDASATLAVTVRVYDAQNTLVRTLVNGSQAVGSQSVVWDGKNDAGTVLPAGVYTVRGNATDGLGFEAPEATATARIGAINYSYDRLYRLTGVSGAAPATTYSYDPVGNRLSMVRGTTTSYTYDRADRISSAGGIAYTFDAKGNVTGRGSDTFVYDQPNRLTNVTIGGVASSYTYDGDGKRATRTTGGATTTYTYDVNRSLPVVLDDGSRKYVWGLGLVYSVQGTNVEVYHADGLGSVRAVTDVNGDVTQTYTRDEFGVPTSTQGTSNQPFGFTGEQRDPESGFMYLRARMYEPGIGRFLQRDALPGIRTLPLSLHQYSYVRNNPMRFTDRSGLGDNQVLRTGEFDVQTGQYHQHFLLTSDERARNLLMALGLLGASSATATATITGYGTYTESGSGFDVRLVLITSDERLVYDRLRGAIWLEPRPIVSTSSGGRFAFQPLTIVGPQGSLPAHGFAVTPVDIAPGTVLTVDPQITLSEPPATAFGPTQSFRPVFVVPT
jgi:RHS repeat-associated protein